jgi:hypothetical protein
VGVSGAGLSDRPQRIELEMRRERRRILVFWRGKKEERRVAREERRRERSKRRRMRGKKISKSGSSSLFDDDEFVENWDDTEEVIDEGTGNIYSYSYRSAGETVSIRAIGLA